ncbi:Signal peptidase I (modular protein) [Vibrio chagasii]|nr:Signal peptidase I (modular protein) [Vibrio chagasii]
MREDSGFSLTTIRKMLECKHSIILSYGMLALVVIWCIFRFNHVKSTNVVLSGSMEPTFLIGDRYLKNTNLRHVSLGVDNFEEYLIKGMFVGVINRHVEPAEQSGKRVIGFPNDTIEMKNGILSLNGERLTGSVIDSVDGVIYMNEKVGDIEYYVQYKQDIHQNTRKFLRNGHWVVPEGKLFVIGDNRDESADSRLDGITNGNFGFINIEDVASINKITSLSTSNITKLQFDRIGCPVHSVEGYLPLDRTCWMRDGNEGVLGYMAEMIKGDI